MARKQGWTQALGNALAMATNMAAAIALGYFGGKYLDNKLGTQPWLTMVLFMLGVATGLKIVYNQAFGNNQKRQAPIKESDNNIKVQPSKEIIESLQAARRSLRDIDAEVRRIYQRDPEPDEDSKPESDVSRKEDGPA